MQANKYKETGSTTLVKTGPGALRGFYISSTGGGTIRFWDNTTNADVPMMGQMIGPVGWYDFGNVAFNTALFLAITGTIEVTVVYQ